MTVLFWDFDGTLVHSESHWSQCVFDALRSVDASAAATFEQIDAQMRRAWPWHTPEEDYTNAVGDAWWPMMEKRFESGYRACGAAPETARAAAQKVRSLIVSAGHYTLYPDAVSTLRAAREMGCQNVLLSNNYPELPEILDALGLSGLLDGMVISSLEGYNKPRQELFMLAQKRFPAQRCIMTGDNPAADAGGAKAAGMTAVLVHRGFAQQADYCFDDLRSVLALV